MEIIIILILILLNGIFSMSEIALVSSRKAKLETEAKRGDSKAQLALDIAESPDRFLSTAQIGITVIGILNGVFGGATIAADIKVLLDRVEIFRPYSHNIAVGTVVVIITYFSLVLGELMPKRIGLAYSERIARVMAKPMNFLSKMTAPFIWLLSSSSSLIMKLLGINANQEIPVTEDEIKAMVEEGAHHGSIEEIEQDIVGRVFDLGDRKIGSLMTTRRDIVWLEINDGPEQIKSKIINNRHTIFVLCEKQLDNVVGVVNVKDILPVYLQHQSLDLHVFQKQVLLIPETTKAYDVLERFRQSKIHFAVVVDEYGTVVGIVTLNDIVNAIVGGISSTNEFDYDIKEREDGSFLVDATLPFEEFINHFKIENFNREGYGRFHTLAGFILSLINTIPQAGERLVWNNLDIEILDMDGNRIDKVLIKKNNISNLVEEN